MTVAPVGTITFLFTDIAGSTRLWQQHPETMQTALQRHHALLNEAIANQGGYVFQIIGDAFCAAFPTACAGLEAAIEAQHALLAEKWGETGIIKVRMALHTGQAELKVGDYTSGEYASGLTLSRAARLLSAGHGGQILVSLPTAELVRDHLPQDVSLRDMGPRRLKDLIRPEQIFQVLAPGLLTDFAPLKTLDVHPHNLPVQLTSFIGREHEMAEIKKLLSSTHLLTLTGTGGTGKTRLALQVAADLIDEFPGGVWLVELAPLHDPALVQSTVTAVLGVREQPDRPLSDLLVEHVREEHMLLILDNCEHLVEASAQLAELLMRSAPELKILATSRVHLNLGGERTYPVQPLALPDPKRTQTVLTLAQYDAVRLFIDRASAIQPSFSITSENAPAVAQICTHLDGIPLAIELAAARTRHLSPASISARLGDRFNLLTGGSRTLLPRQQTLRAAIDWSYDLLSSAECIMFNRQAVFPGSFTLEAAEAICAEDATSAPAEHDISASQVMDLLSALVDHSLVSVQEWNGENRYGFLETVRQYALEKLQATGELASLRDKHLAYFLKLALQGEPYTWIGDPEWIRRFDAEFDNLRTSMEYALSCDPESAILLANSLGMFIDFTSRNFEFNSWIERISIMAESWPPGKMKAMALYFAGDRATYLEDYQHAQDLLESALEMAKELGDKKLVSLITHVLAVNNLRRGDWAQLRYYAEQRLAISRELGDNDGIAGSLWQLGESLCNSGNLKMGRMHLEQSLELARQENFPNCISFALESLSRLAFMEGEYPKARVMLTECAQIRRQMGFRSGLVWTLYRLGQVFLKERDAVQARALFDECLEIFDDMKDISGHLLYIDGNSGIAALTGQDERAARLFGASKAAAEKLNVVMTEFSRKVYEPLIATVRERLGETEFEKLWADGRTLTLEDAIELAKKQNP